MREMRDSGFRYLGAIPSTWPTRRLKHFFVVSRVTGRADATVLSLYRDHGIVPKDSRDDNHNVTSLDTSKYKYVEVGDFVINKMKGWQGSMALSGYEGIVSPAYHVFKITASNLVPSYAHYLLRCQSYADEWRRLSTGLRIGQWDLHVEDFLNASIPVPPIDEQQRIADYLDDKSAEIDRAIDAAVKSIESYESYRTACIGGVFTTVSGPRLKLVYFADSVLGKMLDQSQQKGVNTHRYLANKDVRWFSIDATNLSEMDFPESSEERYGIQDGDILVCEGGEVGRCAVYRGPSPDFYFQKAIHRVRVDQNIVHPEYIAYQMFAKAKTSNFMEVRKGEATFSHLPGEQLKQLRFVIPPFDVQRRIADYLDERCAQIDRAISAKKSIIADLKAYKQSLIYEVVTGKRGV